MSTTLSNGYKLPSDGDLGDTYFDDLEFDITRLNNHLHNGTDSERLEASSSIAVVQNVVTGDFADQGDGYWRATVTVPSGTAVVDFGYFFRDETTKEQIYLRNEILNATQFYVYINIPKDIEVVYTA